MVDMTDPNEMNTSEYIVRRIHRLMDVVSNAKCPGGTILDEWREEIQSLKIKHKKLFNKKWFEV